MYCIGKTPKSGLLPGMLLCTSGYRDTQVKLYLTGYLDIFVLTKEKLNSKLTAIPERLLGQSASAFGPSSFLLTHLQLGKRF